MSSAVVSTPAALGRPFVFDPKADPDVCSPSSVDRRDIDRRDVDRPDVDRRDAEAQQSPLARIQSAICNQKSKNSPARVTPASQLEIRPAPDMVSSGAPAIDALTGGLPRGCLTEICGPASSGRTTLLLAALAAATRRGEFCAVVDASDALDPHSAAAAGVELDHLLWVRCGEDAPQKNSSPQRHRVPENENQKAGHPISRALFAREVGAASQSAFNFHRSECNAPGPKENASLQSEHRLEQVLRATDLLLESGGFGLIVLDLGDLPPQSARRIPLTTWFRFRRAVENKPTILLAIEQKPIAGSCSSLLLQLGATDEPAAERRKIAAHSLPRASRGGASRGKGEIGDMQAPEGRKKIDLPAQPELNLANPTRTQLFTGLNITAELIRSRLDRKPARSIAFATKTAWAG